MGSDTFKPRHSEQRVHFRAMTRENTQLLNGALRELYGDQFDDLTMKEVAARHADLIAALDGKRELGGVAIDDEQMQRLSRASEVRTALHRARAQVAKQIQEDEDREVA